MRAILDHALKALRARLNGHQTERLYQFLLVKCWELSGLEADGETPRYVWELRGFLSPRGKFEPYTPIKLPQFATERSVAIALEGIGRRVAWASIEKVRPRGAYDPSKGLAFATYSHRLLTLRVADWYRADPEFGDSRYSSGQRDSSLEDLASRSARRHAGEHSYSVDRYLPGSRLEFVDELNRHAYQESIEEVLTDETVHC